MGFFTEFTGYKYAEFANKPREVGIPKTASSTIEDVAAKVLRVPRKDLETLMITDAQTFKLINTYKKLLVQAGYRIIADNKTNQKQYDTFFDNIGQIGRKYKLKQLNERIIGDCCLFGYAYVERVFNEAYTKIVDLKPIDAKLMDYVRDTDGRIMTDREQNPLGYTMEVGYRSDAKTDDWPRGARKESNMIFLLPARIASFLLFPYGNGFEAMGLVEPAYKQITRKQKIEESASNAIYNATDSLIYAIIGDSQRSGSKPLMDQTLNTLKNWTTNRRAVFQYPTEIHNLPVEQSPQVPEFLKYLKQDQAMAGGISLGMATGSGESNNKSTMLTERKDFNTQLNEVASIIAEQFTTQILDPLYTVNEYGSKAIMKWNNVSVEDKSDMILTLKTLFDMGSVSPQEARSYAKNVLDLETNEEEYQQYIKSTQYLPEMPEQKGGKLPTPQATKKNISKSKDTYEQSRE